MMAYENNNLANAPFADNMNMFSDALEPSRFEGKLDSNSLGALGFLEQLNSNINNNVNMNAQQQMNGFSNLQLQMNSQTNFLNNNCMSSSNNQNNQNMNNFQQTTLMSSMILQQPFFQASQQQQSQQQRNVPNFIAFQNDNSLTSKPLPTAFEPKPLFGGMEPMPVIEKSEPIKPAGSAISIPRSVSKSKRLLPADFQPCGNYVICGNKRKYFESKGNIRFREVCKLFLQEYIQAPTKIEKSAVVTKVMNILREDCPEGAFVSPQGGRWYAVSERTAREKVGTFFRDCLADSYKSSAKNKIARRKIIKKANSVNNSSSNSEENISDDNSLESISFYDVDDLTPVPL